MSLKVRVSRPGLSFKTQGKKAESRLAPISHECPQGRLQPYRRDMFSAAVPLSA